MLEGRIRRRGGDVEVVGKYNEYKEARREEEKKRRDGQISIFDFLKEDDSND